MAKAKDKEVTEAEGGPKPKDFEEALATLEGIVQELEGGELSLEMSLARYEQGVGLARFCASKLDEAEKRIEVLQVDDAGDPKRDATGAVRKRALDLDTDAQTEDDR